MAFCPSCGAENPDVAKFCAKCGQALVAPQAAVNQSKASVAPQPAAAPAPQPAAPAQKTAKEALASPPVPKPPKVRNEPDPNAPGQTQFFMAAAGVSTGSKIKRIILFIIGAVIVGTGLFLLIDYGFIKKDPPKVKAKAVQTTPMEPMNSPDPQAKPVPAGQEPKTDNAAAKDAKEPPKPATDSKGKKKSR